MKKHSFDYIAWSFLLLVNLFAVGALFYGAYFGLTYQKKYTMDLSGISVGVAATVILLLFLWELFVLVDFLVKDEKAEIIMDENRLTIIRGRKEEVLDLNDLVRVEFSGPRTGSRSVTSNLMYCKLYFKNKEVILTSLTMHNDYIRKNIGRHLSKTINRERRFFELIK